VGSEAHRQGWRREGGFRSTWEDPGSALLLEMSQGQRAIGEGLGRGLRGGISVVVSAEGVAAEPGDRGGGSARETPNQGPCSLEQEGQNKSNLASLAFLCFLSAHEQKQQRESDPSNAHPRNPPSKAQSSGSSQGRRGVDGAPRWLLQLAVGASEGEASFPP